MSCHVNLLLTSKKYFYFAYSIKIGLAYWQNETYDINWLRQPKPWRRMVEAMGVEPMSVLQVATSNSMLVYDFYHLLTASYTVPKIRVSFIYCAVIQLKNFTAQFYHG